MFANTHSLRRSYTFIVLATALIVAAADFFFYNHAVGWTAAAIVAAMFCLITARDARFLRSNVGRVFTIALIGLLAALVEQPFYINIAYAILCLSGIAIINAQGPENDFTRWISRWTRWLLLGWMAFFTDNSAVMRFLLRRGVSPSRARGIAAWFLPAILSCVFIALFAWANPIIYDWLSQLGDKITYVLNHLADIFNPVRICFWLIFAVATWMLLRGRTSRRPKTPVSERSDNPDCPTTELSIPAAFVIRCLLLFNIIFAVENALDLRYLYSEKLPAGVTYTQYVHRGAYPLIAAALLAGVFVLITFRPKSETEKSRTARHLVYAWIAQTILLTASAAWRLRRYIDMTEITRLRVASIIWFFIVAMGLFYIVWRIISRRSNAWLININALTALLVLYPCCFINFDGLIADFNATHCEEAAGGGSPIDLDYFRTLGPTSLAALERTRAKLIIPSRQKEAAEVSNDLHEELTTELSDWRSWTWRRQRAAQNAESWAQANATNKTQLAGLVSSR